MMDDVAPFVDALKADFNQGGPAPTCRYHGLVGTHASVIRW
jgi:hypothetical protein